MKEYLSSFLVLEGFAKASTNMKQFDVFLKKETGHITVLFVLEQNSEPFTEDTVNSYRQNALKILKEKNLPEIHALFLILTDNPDSAVSATAGDYYTWIMDTGNRVLIIPDDRAEDFYGMKGRFQAFLKEPERANELLSKMEGKLAESIREEERKEARKVKESIPWVSIGIIGVNLIVGLITLLLGESFVRIVDLDPVAVFEHNEWYRLITYMFVHGSVEHILSNMLMLYLEGNMIEKSLGRWRFAVIFVLFGMLSGLGSLMFKVFTGSNIPSIGASGAIMGIMGLVMYIVMRSIKTLGRGGWYRVFGIIACAGYMIYEGFADEGVDNAAHVAGLVAGILVGIGWDILNRHRYKKKTGGKK